MEQDDDILEIIAMVTMLKKARECLNEMGRRRYWVRPQYQDRDTNGFFALHFDRMYNRNTQQFKKLVGMSREVFDLLFGFLEEGLTKNSNRPAVSAKCRLFLTLTYLHQGGSRKELCEKFKMGLSTVKKIILDTCNILWKQLNHLYMCPPKDREWLHIANEFHDEWKLSNCVGAVKAKRISLSCSSKINNKKHSKQSIVVLASCDANYMFTNVDIGLYNKQTDNTTWSLQFCNQILSGKLHLPDNGLLPNSDIKFPYYMIGDKSCPLKTYLMRPYPVGHQLTPDRLIFNEHIARAYSVAKNAFGILTARWKILQRPMHMNASTAEVIIKATVLLHNFLKTHDESYCPPGYVDVYDGEDLIEGVWRQQVSSPLQNHGRISGNNATQTALDARNYLMFYINSIKQLCDE